MNNSSKKTIWILTIILIATNVFWAIKYSSEMDTLNKAQEQLSAVVYNKKMLAFQKLFVDKVLRSNGEVDFDTRVMLQNSVNDTGDQEVIGAWNTFLKSKTEADGQARVKELLSLMASKVYTN